MPGVRCAISSVSATPTARSETPGSSINMGSGAAAAGISPFSAGPSKAIVLTISALMAADIARRAACASGCSRLSKARGSTPPPAEASWAASPWMMFSWSLNSAWMGTSRNGNVASASALPNASARCNGFSTTSSDFGWPASNDCRQPLKRQMPSSRPCVISSRVACASHSAIAVSSGVTKSPGRFSLSAASRADR